MATSFESCDGLSDSKEYLCNSKYEIEHPAERIFELEVSTNIMSVSFDKDLVEVCHMGAFVLYG